MKARIKFVKAGSMKFIGHLDLMRFFQKAFRRCDMDVAYSQGYSPHQLISFASPLGVGLTSDGEYLDIQFHSIGDIDETIQKINHALNAEIQVTGISLLSDHAKNSMSIVEAADYMISVKDGYFNHLNFKNEFTVFIEQEKIIVSKKTKKSEKEEDIKPFIYDWAFDRDSFLEKGGRIPKNSAADQYENGNRLFVKVAAGSRENLKPELIMKAYAMFQKEEWNPYAYQIHRLELYAWSEEDACLIPLDQAGI